MSKENEERFQKPDEKVVAELRDIQGEFAQLSELDEMEHNYALKLVDQLKQIQSVVNSVVPLAKESLPEEFSRSKEAYLTVDAVMVLVDEEGKHTSVPISRLEPNQILSIVTQVTPVLKKAIAEKRRATGERVDVLERILREVKKASSSLKETSRYADQTEEDLVASSIASE
jgi:hypothetical protein